VKSPYPDISQRSPQPLTPAPALRWYALAAQAFRQHMLLKAFGTMLFIGVFFGAYFYVLKHPAYPITVMPITALDRWIHFEPRALSLYLSLWVYVSLPPALLSTQQQLFAYARAIAVTCLVGLLIFYFWPTAVPAVNIDWTQYPDVDFLKNIDASGNACPSLHVATAIFSGIWLHHLLRGFGAPRWLRVLNMLWCVGIVYSTIATRQHVAVDVWAGIALGALVAYGSLHRGDAALRQSTS